MRLSLTNKVLGRQTPENVLELDYPIINHFARFNKIKDKRTRTLPIIPSAPTTKSNDVHGRTKPESLTLTPSKKQ